MADIEYLNTRSPQMYVYVDFNSSRSGSTVTITATATLAYRYPSGGGYLGVGWELWFELGRSPNETLASDRFLASNERWYASNESSRTVSCSISFNTYDSASPVYCRVVTTNGNYQAGTMPDTGLIINFEGYRAPTAPTWINTTPNPCSINSAPLILWGNGQAGSNGQIYYDVEVRSSIQSGGYTNWLRISSAQRRTSYQEIKLANMNVYGIVPYVGVNYHYRVRSSDGVALVSDWISIQQNVSFISPSPPTNVQLSSSTIPLTATTTNQFKLTLTCTGASGGAGSIQYYFFNFRIYQQSTKTWTDWSAQSSSLNGIKNFYFPGDFDEFGITFQNDDLIQFRVCVQNSYGVNSSYVTTSSIKLRGNIIRLKNNGTWITTSSYFKNNGNWSTATPYLKYNGAWNNSL